MKKHKPTARLLAGLIYGVLLAAFCVYTLLEVFVLPSSIVKADGQGKTSRGTDEHPVITDTSYEDSEVSIRITTKRVKDTTCYIADVKLTDASRLKAGLAKGSFGRNVTEATSKIAEDNGAIFAINGDYYGFRTSGYVLRNGQLYRDNLALDTNGEDLVLWEDGTMEIVSESDRTAKDLQAAGAQQIYSFGPGLVENGEIAVVDGEEVERAQVTNPRTAIGMVKPLHYMMVVCDGRTSESHGLSLVELAGLMQDLGCTEAYNLDGGGSSTMVFNGKVLNRPTTFGDTVQERAVSDALLVTGTGGN